MRNLTGIILTLLLGACGHAPAINKDLQASVDRYLNHAPNHGHIGELISVDWGTPPNGALGQCEVKAELGGGHARKIRILNRGDYSPNILDALVAHELGHCLHDKVHNDSRAPALMNTQLVEAKEFWDMHLDEEIEGIFK